MRGLVETRRNWEKGVANSLVALGLTLAELCWTLAIPDVLNCGSACSMSISLHAAPQHPNRIRIYPRSIWAPPQRDPPQEKWVVAFHVSFPTQTSGSEPQQKTLYHVQWELQTPKVAVSSESPVRKREVPAVCLFTSVDLESGHLRRNHLTWTAIGLDL